MKTIEILDRIQTYVSLCVLAFIGALFIYKYSARFVDSPVIAGLCAGIYLIIYLVSLIIILRSGIPHFPKRTDQRLLLVAMSILVILVIGIVYFTPEASRVSRLFALKEWLGRFLSGSYPWSFSIQYNPSGLPFLFIIALPFYLVGNLGLLEVLGVILFFISITLLFPQPKARWLPLVALILLPSFYYEPLVRSELLFNISLVIILMILAERYLDPDRMNFSFFFLAALFGLVLSTRTVVGLIYAVYYVYRFRQQVLRGILFSGITLFFFGLTLIPFIIWDPHQFFTQGPFFMQLLHLPIGLAGLLVIVAIFAGWKVASFRHVIFLSGILLFIMVGSAFLLTSVKLGLNPSLLNDGFDITYFIFCVPLLILSLDAQAVDTDL